MSSLSIERCLEWVRIKEYTRAPERASYKIQICNACGSFTLHSYACSHMDVDWGNKKNCWNNIVDPGEEVKRRDWGVQYFKGVDMPIIRFHLEEGDKERRLRTQEAMGMLDKNYAYILRDWYEEPEDFQERHLVLTPTTVGWDACIQYIKELKAREVAKKMHDGGIKL